MVKKRNVASFIIARIDEKAKAKTKIQLNQFQITAALETTKESLLQAGRLQS